MRFDDTGALVIAGTGFGDDHVTSGAGADVIHGDIAGGDCGPACCKLPHGNDTIDARDGEVDSVTCGTGSDRVVADGGDVVAGDCETVERPGGSGGGGAARPEDGAGGLAAAAARGKLARALRKGFAVRIDAPGARRLSAVARRGAKVVAKGRGSVSGPGAATVRLRFTSKARAVLRRARAVKVAVAVTWAPEAGAALRRTVKVTFGRQPPAARRVAEPGAPPARHGARQRRGKSAARRPEHHAPMTVQAPKAV